MQIRSSGLVLLYLAFGSWVFAQQSSLVGTWVGKVQGYEVEMKLVLNADGSADYEGVLGKWRVQASKLLLTEEGATVAYDFKLQGSQLTISGGDLMAPMIMTRAGGGGAGRAPAPVVLQPETSYETEPTPTPQPTTRKRPLSEAEVVRLLEGSVSSRRIIDLVEERGTSFPITQASASRLKAKGATNALIGALQQAADQGVRENVSKGDEPSGPAPNVGPSDPNLLRAMAGEYYSYAGSTERKLMLCPNGTFWDSRESSYSGSFGTNQGGWGAASQGSGSGSYAIQGSVQDGTINFSYKSGKRSQSRFQCKSERGCCSFDGTTFCYSGAARCQ